MPVKTMQTFVISFPHFYSLLPKPWRSAICSKRNHMSRAYMTVHMQHSHHPPSPVGHATQPCLWPLTMLEVADVEVEVVEDAEVVPGILS